MISSSEMAKAMYDNMPESIKNSTSKKDKEKLLSHDPFNPFSRTYVDRTFMGKPIGGTTFCGNCVSIEGIQYWIDQEGNKIDPRKKMDWSKDQAELLQSQINSAGLDAVIKITKNRKEEPYKVFLSLPERSGIYQSPYYHYVTLKVFMPAIIGKMSMRTFRIDSCALPNIGSRFVEHIRALSDAMPKTPEEASETARKNIIQNLNEAYAVRGITPDIVEIKEEQPFESLVFNLKINMLNGLLQKKIHYETICFRGEDPRNPWKPTIQHRSKTTSNISIKIEKRRRDILEATGMRQTTLAQNVIKKLGWKPMPLHENGGNIVKQHFMITGKDKKHGYIKGNLIVKDARIEAEITYGDGDIKITTGRVTIKKAEVYPESVLLTLKGKRLNQVIENELISDDIKITSAAYEWGQLKLQIRMDTVPVERDNFPEKEND